MTTLGTARHARAWRTLALAVAVAAPAAASAQGAPASHAPASHAWTTHTSTQESPAMGDIVQVAIDAGSFTTLVAAVKAAGLVETLQGEGPFTVFAPSDDAFAKLPKGTIEALLADKAALTAVLTLHVVPGRVAAADILKAGGAEPRTVNGQALDIEVHGNGVRVNGATVTTADIPASNGVIHVIDTVLLPAPAPAGR
jgi:uncharacterized surface protein with fasciclin (FAS1) repeats